MGKKLIIVESPTKAKTIGKILGTEFVVMPSVGHIRDLPERTLGIDTKDSFELKYEIPKGKAKVVSELKKAAKDAEIIYLAPDPDREGEAIAWHLREVLSAAGKNKQFMRVRYNEITPRAVNNAVNNPGEIDVNLVDAQQARRAFDRIVGYKISPLLWRNIKGNQKGLSAGRVQTVALRLVCERERSIMDFTPEAFWIISAILKKQSPEAEPFSVKLVKINGEKAEIRSEERAKEILADLDARTMRVAARKSRQLTRRPSPPFITSSLQQTASSFLGFSPTRTMGLAQKLYEGIDLGRGAGTVGLITYMRTDAPAVAKDAQEAALAFISDNYGTQYRPATPNFFKSKIDAQGAHEAIRPTDVTRTPASLASKLRSDELKLYDLIWRRFVASQMASAKIVQNSVEIEACANATDQDKYTFSASSSSVEFDGFLKVLELDIKKTIKLAENRDNDGNTDDDEEEADKLPMLSENEALDCVSLLDTRKETKPPTRFSEAALIKTLEENGVGRPSTYASITETLVDHKYATRERRTLIPTERGFQVFDYLKDNLPKLFEVGFTAEMESDLDKIEEAGLDWRNLVKCFFNLVMQLIENTKAPPADREKVAAVLATFDKVTEWAPPIKSGRGKRDDSKFVSSIKEQFEKNEKPVTEAQLNSLITMAMRYSDQLADIEERLTALGFADLVRDWKNRQTPPIAKEKLALLVACDLPERQRMFATSLHQQIEARRTLSEKQLAAIDKLMISCVENLPEKEKTLDKFGIAKPESTATAVADLESPVLIEALAKITTWREPQTRGKRTFDDKAFFESVSGQFATKGVLSPRQRGAMRKMISRYKDQIPNAAETLATTASKKHDAQS